MAKINLLLQNFWEVDNSGTESASSLNHEDKLALHMVEKSIKYIKGSYEVSIPWKKQSISLQNNF